MMRIGSIILALAVASAAPAQSSAQPVQRDKWYDGNTRTSDDLRRVPVPKTYREPDSAVLITNARLFDGTGAKARPANILIRGSRIIAIAADAAGISLPENLSRIDAAGRTVMPGLIDLHAHLTYTEAVPQPDVIGEQSQSGAALRGQERLRYFLESGVTAVRDVASHGMAIFLLKDFVADGRLAGPRIFAAGSLITGIGGHGTEGFGMHTAPSFPDGAVYEASGPDEFRAAVRLQFKKGADLIKLGSHFSQEEVNAAVDEAHKLGLRVAVDSETIYTEMAVKAGADVIEHPLPRSDETVRMMAAKKIYSDITLVPYQIINAGGGYNFSTSRRFTTTNDAHFAMARKLRNAGVILGVGTDLVADWIKYMPDAYIQELRNFKVLGYGDAEALVVATKTNSEILGMDDRLGTIAIGKLADIIIVDGKPDEDIEALKAVDTVIVHGRIVMQGGRASIERHRGEKPPYTAPKP